MKCTEALKNIFNNAWASMIDRDGLYTFDGVWEIDMDMRGP